MRAARLLNTLLMLETRGRVTARELAAAFEVSVRTVHRDIEALSSAGVPVYAERGASGGFRLAEGRRFGPSGLVAEEAAAMPFSGLPAVAAELGQGEAAWGAWLKLLAGLPEPFRDEAAQVSEVVHVDLGPSTAADAPVQLMRGLLDAVRRRRVIGVRSTGADGTRSVVEVAPLGLVRNAAGWQLIVKRGRTISVIAVASIELARATGATFEAPAGFELRRWWRGRSRRPGARGS
jgi:predicted DNA-binding transcriptional regulator YafY